MGIKEDIKYAEEKSQLCGQCLPPKLEKMEGRIFERLKKSKRSTLNKLDDLYQSIDKLSSHIGKYATCKKGCSSCCFIRVDVSEVEIQYIEKRYKIKRNKDIRPDTDGSGSACCFLKDGACSIYEGRPFFCRTHFFFTPDETWCAHDSVGSKDVEFPLLRFSEIDKSHYKVIMKDDPRVYDIREVFGTK